MYIVLFCGDGFGVCMYVYNGLSFTWRHYSIVGTVIIVGGLYLVLWGKNKEMKSIPTTSNHIETNKTSKDITLNNLPTLSTNVL